MASIKVAHITSVSVSLQRLLLHQLQSLQAAGYDVFGISSPGDAVPALAAAGIRHWAVPITRRISPFADLATLLRLYRVLRAEQCVIVHTHNPKPGLLGQLAARMARVPIVVNTLHGFYFHDHMAPRQRRFYIEMEKIAARCSDVILSQNQEDMQTAIREGICAPDKIKHLGNGIDLAQFRATRITPGELAQKRAELALPAASPVVGFVGRLAARRKGFGDFMAAARQVIQQLPQVRFLIIGTADQARDDAVQPAIAHDYGIAEHCLFLGQRPNSELPVLYRLMNVLVLPSLFEGIPRVVMEAAAMGVPVVATDVKGNREAVEDGQNGILVPYGAVDRLQQAIVTLLEQRDQARQMGMNGQRRAHERFDERLVFEKVKSEYSRLLHQKGFHVPEVEASRFRVYGA